MAKKPGPTLRAQLLGQQLRQLRESAGLTLQDAGEYLQRNSSMVSRFESAEYPIRRGDVMALLTLYGVSDERRGEALLQLSEEVWRKGWWEQYADAIYDWQFVDYPWLEERASEIRSYDAMVIPGLMQTREYAKSMIWFTEPAATAEQVDRWADLRAARQRILDGEAPTRLAAVLDESVLRRVVGGPEVMRAQLTRLLELARSPTVELRVLPFGAGAHQGIDGGFKVFEMPDPYPNVAYVENLAGRVYVEAEGMERFAQAYDQQCNVSLDSDESAGFIAARAEEL